MGKAADNERIKLKATFYNNLAVATFVGGGVLPILTLATTDYTNLVTFKAVASLMTFFAAAYFGRWLRGLADEANQQIQD